MCQPLDKKVYLQQYAINQESRLKIIYGYILFLIIFGEIEV